MAHSKVNVNKSFILDNIFENLKKPRTSNWVSGHFANDSFTHHVRQVRPGYTCEFFSRRQRNGSTFIALLPRVIKLHVSHTLRGNAIVTGHVEIRKLKYFNFRQRLPKISNYSRIVWAGNVKAIFSQPMKFAEVWPLCCAGLFHSIA